MLFQNAVQLVAIPLFLKKKIIRKFWSIGPH